MVLYWSSKALLVTSGWSSKALLVTSGGLCGVVLGQQGIAGD